MAKKIKKADHQKSVEVFSRMRRRTLFVATPGEIREAAARHGDKTVSEFLFFTRESDSI